MKMALAKWRYNKIKKQIMKSINPSQYCLVSPSDTNYWFRFEQVSRSDVTHRDRAYSSRKVDQVIAKLGIFIYNDIKSDQMLRDMKRIV